MSEIKTKIAEDKEPVLDKSTSEIHSALEDLKENDLFKEVYEQIQENAQEYIVQKGDTLSSIAQKVGVSSYIDLLYLNNIMENPLKTGGKNGTRVTIKPGDKIIVPISGELFKTHIEVIKNTYDNIELNQKIISKDLKVLQKALEMSIFNKRVQSLGLPNLLDGFIGAQLAQFDPRHPRIVDHSRENLVTCANLIRTLMGSSVNIGDLTKKEKAFLMKQNVDAWMLPTEVMKIGFEQEFDELMKQFDKGRIGLEDPLKPGTKQRYDELVNELGKYMKDNPERLKGSLLPLYFVYSGSKGKVANYNRNRGEDVHYNTHQSMFAGNADFKFYACEVDEIKDGKRTKFQQEQLPSGQNIEKLLGKMQDTKVKMYGLKTQLKKVIDSEENPLIQKELDKLNKLFREVCKGDENKFNELILAIETQDINYFTTKASEILGFQVGEKFVKQAMFLFGQRNKLLEDLEEFTKRLEEKIDFNEISLDNIDSFFSDNEIIKSAILKYNQVLQELLNKKNKLKEKKLELNNVILEIQHFEGRSDLSGEEVVERTNFINKKIELEKEIKGLKDDYNNSKFDFYSARDQVLLAFQNTHNSGLKEQSENLDNMLNTIVGSDSTNKNILKNKIKEGDFEGAKRIVLISKHTLTTKEYNKLRNLVKKYDNIISTISNIEKDISDKDDSRIDLSACSNTIKGNKQIASLVKEYNSYVDIISKTQEDINKVNEQSRSEKSINIMDFIANFIQNRGDFSQRIYQDSQKARIIEGVGKFPDLIDMKVNGVKVDIKQEYEKYKSGKKDCLKIKPTDEITFSGPMMTDGEKQHNHQDQDRREKMNARTRFYFEFVVPGWYLPSEFLVPGEESSFAQRDFGRLHNKLNVKGTYDLRDGEQLEEKLREQFEIYEGLVRPTSDGKTQEEYQQELNEYEKVFRSYYAKQIKALQMAGFLQSESRLNPGAFKINRAIPYYDMSGNQIENVFNEFIAQKKEQSRVDNEQFSAIRDFVKLEIFPGDTYRSMFSRVSEYVKPHQSKIKYPALKMILDLNEMQIKDFMKEFITLSSKTNDALTFEKIEKGDFKPNDSFILSLKDINELLVSIFSKEGIKKDFEGRVVDNLSMNMIVGPGPNQELIRHVLQVESYGSQSGTGIRTYLKMQADKDPDKKIFGLKKVDSWGDFQVRLNCLNEYGFNEEWLTKDQLQKALDWVTDDNVKKIASFAPNEADILEQYSKDKKEVEEIRRILSLPEMNSQNIKAIRDESKQKQVEISEYRKEINILNKKLEEPNIPEQEKLEIQNRIKEFNIKIQEIELKLDKLLVNFRTIYKILSRLIKLDDGTSTNIVGKMISISIMNDKLLGHIKKLSGLLEKSGESIIDIFNDKNRLISFENVVLVINNLGEENVKFACVENYILRIVNRAVGLNMQSDSVLYDYTFRLTAKPNGTTEQTEQNTSISSMQEILDFFSQVTISDVAQYKKQVLNALGDKIDYDYSVFKTHLGKYSQYIRQNLGQVEGKDKEILQIVLAFCEGVGTSKFSTIDFLSNPNIKQYLREKSLSDSILPNGDEFKSTAFAKSVFKYANKG